MIEYQVRHTTTYSYLETASQCQNQVHLSPRNSIWQKCLSADLSVDPQPTFVESWQDYFGNTAHYFTLETTFRRLKVTAHSRVVVQEPSIADANQTAPWESVAARLCLPATQDDIDATQFTFESPYVPRDEETHQFARESFSPGRPLLDAALDLTSRIFREFKYDPNATDLQTPTREVLRRRRGVCQDFAHLEIACLRSLGLAARYVSGYLSTDPPSGQPKLVGADASHAWLSVYIPDFGWVDLDPTNNQIPKTRHVTVAWGRDYSDVCPIKGVFLGGGPHILSVAVDVTPVN